MLKFKKIKGNLVHTSSIINWDKINIGKGNIIGPNVIIGTDAQHPYSESKGKIIIQKLISGEKVDPEQSGLSKREWNELMTALELNDKLI